MTKTIDFYFDFISPYSYLAHKRIIHLNKRDKFNYKPILLGGLHNLGGITAPAFNERKIKSKDENKNPQLASCFLINNNKIFNKPNDKPIRNNSDDK